MNSRRKGRGGELEAAKLLKELGFDVEVMSPMQARTSLYPDVQAAYGPLKFAVEVKRPKALRSLLYDALDQAGIASGGLAAPVVMVRADRRPWLVVMEPTTLAEVLRWAVEHREQD